MATQEELNFASKLIDTGRMIKSKLDRSYRWSFGVSIILFFISVGVLDIKNEITIGVIKLNISVTYVIIILSCFLAFAQLSCISLSIEYRKLSDRIEALYRKFASDLTSIKDSDYNYLTYPGFTKIEIGVNFLSSTKIGAFLNTNVTSTILIGILILPLISQGFAINYLFNIYGINGYICVMSSLLLVFHSIVIYSVIQDNQNN
jgi:hypothetical protein